MTVRKTHTYSDNWDQFIQRIENNGMKNRAVLLDQLSWDEKIAMIVALSKDWTAAQDADDPYRRRRERESAAAEAARLTPRENAFRPYVSEVTLSKMPPRSVRRRDKRVRWESTSRANAYFKRLDRWGLTRPERIIRIVRNDLRLSPQQWAGMHPYGPKVPMHDLDRYRANQVRPWRLRRKKMAFNPSGMTPERALEIAIRALG